VLTVLLILGCATAPEPLPDVFAYAEAARIAPEDPERAADLCELVGGEAGQECLALTAAEVAMRDLALASSLCERIPDGVWQDEGAFLVADAAVRTGHIDDAGIHCASAGRFADNCLMHVWKRHAAGCLDGGVVRLDVASDCHLPALAWATGVLTVDDALESRFWDVFFDASTGAHGGRPATIDMSRCGELADETLRERCDNVMPFTLQRALNRAGRKPSEEGAVDRDILCDEEGGELVDRIHRATGITYLPHERLDAIAARQATRLCGGGPPR